MSSTRTVRLRSAVESATMEPVTAAGIMYTKAGAGPFQG
ncbi:uncharacterized protein ANIA_11496 [Aspergillus nidulans FGSC A4]|uniref:Uncharacterized protein n=1 Tax=Emericella nidulans (strain FGSC A4 / ATCC 38163 / CBS 112.46 / NRRL 194 / M139) TaxID=227321 RepID=C8V3D0_EMENI|nr:hypothetical protein [Aspergillus nidulans FGSC A4]CBF70457.1 TPA: hypothetical protein ANIA_11496 [Aspergillus nidulans FGSC A4]